MTSVEEQNQDGEDGGVYEEYLGTLKPRQDKIQSVELRFREKVGEAVIVTSLEDSLGNVIFTDEINGVNVGKKVTLKKAIPIEQEETYTIQVKVAPLGENALKTVHIEYETFQKDEFLSAIGFMILAMGLWIFLCVSKKENKTELPKICYVVFLFLTSLFAFWMLEYIFVNDIWKSVDSLYLWINWLMYAAVYLMLLILTNSFKASAFLGTGFFFVWAMVNEYVYLFKGQPLQPVDLQSIRTAADVASEYDYTLTAQMMVAISGLILFVLLWSVVKDRKLLEGKNRKRQACRVVSGVLFVILVYSCIFQSEYIPNLSLNLDMWDTRLGCENNGTVLAFFGYWRKGQVTGPENYSLDEVEALVSAYASDTDTEQEEQKEKPNIVVVMNEAFADLSYLGDFETNVPYLTNYNSVTENVIKGNALVSIYGGGTPNSEYEFLTGHSLGFLPGAIPYAQHINDEHLTMVTNLRNQGYQTWGIHPMQGVNWRRNVVYPYLGFEKSVFIDEMGKETIDRIRNYPSDQATYDYVMELLREKEEDTPAFIFDVTVQNHSGFTYSGKNYDGDEVFVEGFDSSEVNQYLTLMKKSDEALGKLIEELKNFDEPTMLVFFGDHNPRVPEEFYSFIMGEEAVGSTLEAAQKRFTVPFLIWTNYDMPENDWANQENVYTSLNFLGAKTLELAGAELSCYDKLRIELADSIPAMNANGYVDAQGTHHSYEEQNEYTEMLNQYWQAEYNEMFDIRNRVNELFTTEN